jgi:3-hexulose-6-phosphate synthase
MVVTACNSNTMTADKDSSLLKKRKGENRMKLHISYNIPDLAHALDIAQQTAAFADILGVGSLLLFKEGVNAIKTFKKTFPDKEIFAETRISEKAEESVTMFAQAGASYISVLAGSYHSTIKKAVDAAKKFDAKIALDLFNASSTGQSALDAKTLGIHLIILHRTLITDESAEIESEWRNVKDNTKLPIFITGKIDQTNFQQILELKPQGISIGSAITQSENPAKMASFFKSLM